LARKLGIGVVGMGWMGMLHSRCYRQIQDRFPDYGIEPRLIICADEVEERAKQGQQRFGFEQYTRDWKEVVAHPEVEAVNIAASNDMHLEAAVAAAAAGKHIYCEKPVGRSPEETALIERAARQAGVLTFVGYNYRWAPLVQHAQDLIRNGGLGKLTHYRGRFLVGYASSPYGVLSWRFQKEKAGLGTLGDLMSHVIDMAHMMAGPISRVVATRETFIPRRPLAVPGAGTHFSIRKDGPTGEVTNEDYVGALVQFADGVRGTFEACRVITGPQCQMAFEINGTNGALAWDFERLNELELFRLKPDGSRDGSTNILSGPEHPFHARFNPGPGVGLGYEDLKTIEASQFVKSIAEGRQGQPGFAEALAVANVQAAMIRSWETGCWEEVKSSGG